MDAHLDNAYAHVRPSSWNDLSPLLMRARRAYISSDALTFSFMKASRYNKSLPHVRQA